MAEKDGLSQEHRDILERVAEESGSKIERLIAQHKAKVIKIMKMRKSDNGKYRVLGVDKYDGEHWLHGEYETAEQAVAEARRLTKDDMDLVSHAAIATIWYAYDPEGKYIGGDVWEDIQEPQGRSIIS